MQPLKIYMQNPIYLFRFSVKLSGLMLFILFCIPILDSINRKSRKTRRNIFFFDNEQTVIRKEEIDKKK